MKHFLKVITSNITVLPEDCSVNWSISHVGWMDMGVSYERNLHLLNLHLLRAIALETLEFPEILFGQTIKMEPNILGTQPLEARDLGTPW